MEQDELEILANKIEGLCTAQDCGVLYTLARDLDKEGVILEIGSFKGRVTVCLAKAVEEKKTGRVYTIDAGLFGTKSVLLDNLKKFGVQDLVVPKFSHSASANMGWDKPIKMLWIDTDGNYFPLKCDLILWERHLVIGGIIALGCATSLNIKRFVQDFIMAKGRFERLTTIGEVVYAYKIKEAPVYSKLRICYVRFIYVIYFISKKILYSIIYMFPVRIRGKEFAFKKFMHRLFERLL